MASKYTSALFSLFSEEDRNMLPQVKEAVQSLKDAITNFRKGVKELQETGTEFKKSSSDFTGGSGSTGPSEYNTAQVNYVKSMSYIDAFNSFTYALGSTVSLLGSIATKAAAYESALTNTSYRMTDPLGQMNTLYTQEGLFKVNQKLNEDAGKPWQGMQYQELVGATELYLQYGKLRNDMHDKNLLSGIEDIGKIAGASNRYRGLDMMAGTESAMKYNVIGVERKDLLKFTQDLGDMARIGSMASREVLAIDSAIRRLSMAANRSSEEIKAFGTEYMKVAGIISLVGGNPVDMMQKMNQWSTGSESGMINSLILGYDPSKPEQQLDKTRGAANNALQMLQSVPATMQPFVFNAMAPGLGLQGFDFTDLQPLARTGTTGKKSSTKILEDIADNTGKHYSASADKFAAAINQVNMSIVRVGQGQLEGMTKLLGKIAPPLLNYLAKIAGYAKEHYLIFAGVLTGINVAGGLLKAYFAYKMGAAGASAALEAAGIGAGAGATGAAAGAFGIGALPALAVGIAGAAATVVTTHTVGWAAEKWQDFGDKNQLYSDRLKALKQIEEIKSGRITVDNKEEVLTKLGKQVALRDKQIADIDHHALSLKDAFAPVVPGNGIYSSNKNAAFDAAVKGAGLDTIGMSDDNFSSDVTAASLESVVSGVRSSMDTVNGNLADRDAMNALVVSLGFKQGGRGEEKSGHFGDAHRNFAALDISTGKHSSEDIVKLVKGLRASNRYKAFYEVSKAEWDKMHAENNEELISVSSLNNFDAMSPEKQKEYLAEHGKNPFTASHVHSELLSYSTNSSAGRLATATGGSQGSLKDAVSKGYDAAVGIPRIVLGKNGLPEVEGSSTALASSGRPEDSSAVGGGTDPYGSRVYDSALNATASAILDILRQTHGNKKGTQSPNTQWAWAVASGNPSNVPLDYRRSQPA